MWAQHVFRGLVLFQVNGTSLLSLSNFSLYRAMAGGVSDISLFHSENSVKGEFLKCPFWFLLARFQGGSVRSCLRRPRIFLPHFFLSVVLSFFKCGGVRVLCVLLVPRRDLLLYPLGATALSSSLFCSCAYAKLMIAPVGERASTMGGVSPYTRILVILGITG